MWPRVYTLRGIVGMFTLLSGIYKEILKLSIQCLKSNNNSDHIPSEDRWKWVDHLTAVEVVNMINIAISSYNFRQHVASDIPVHGQYVDPQNLQTQK